jgi:hypothetical protein
VAFLEADDLFTPDCLRLRLEAVRRSGSGAVFNHIRLLVEPGATADGYTFFVNDMHKRYSCYLKSFSLLNELFIYNPIPTFSCAMVCRDILTACNFAPPVRRWLDWWIWLQVAQRVNFTYAPEKLSIWRVHTASYNHTVGARQYMADAKAMRAGFRNICAARTQPVQLSVRILLWMPFFIPLVSRAIHMAASFGLSGLVKKIHERISFWWRTTSK